VYAIVNFLRSSPCQVQLTLPFARFSLILLGCGTLVWAILVFGHALVVLFGHALVVFGVGCDAIWRLGAPPLRHFWLDDGQSKVVTLVVGVCC
jgi:hypothetical protein